MGTRALTPALHSAFPALSITHMKRFAPFLLTLLLMPLLMGMSKKTPYVLTFHAQAAPEDPPKTFFPFDLGGQRLIFKMVPEVSQENVVAFHPFDSETGNGKGVALQLDFRGRENLYIVTQSRRGQVLLAMVNGKPADYVVMDEPVADGLITIWQGVTPEVIAAMDKKVPRIKAGGPPSASDKMDMPPIGKRERKAAMDAQKAEKKAAEKARKEGRSVEPEVPSLPAAPTTHRMPVEGAPTPAPAPAPGAPAPSAPVPYVPPLPRVGPGMADPTLPPG